MFLAWDSQRASLANSPSRSCPGVDFSSCGGRSWILYSSRGGGGFQKPSPAVVKGAPKKPAKRLTAAAFADQVAARDTGLTMWLLAQIADQMLQDDRVGAMEMLDLTFVLSLQEDPPPGIIRPPSSNPRLKHSHHSVLPIGLQPLELCQGGGHNIHPPPRSPACEERQERGRRDPRSKEATSESQEAKEGRRQRRRGLSPDISGVLADQADSLDVTVGCAIAEIFTPAT